MWPFNLSVRLLIADLVSRYLTNYLIRHEPILKRIAPFLFRRCLPNSTCGISTNFSVLSPSLRQVAHALLTRPPLSCSKQASHNSVRLECVRHAASVHPEPGSNSLMSCFIYPSYARLNFLFCSLLFKELTSLCSTSHLMLCSTLLFNFQCPFVLPARSPLWLSRGQLGYSTTTKSICQYLFSTFFNFFQKV